MGTSTYSPKHANISVTPATESELHKIIDPVGPVAEKNRAQTKVRIHIVLIFIAGTVSTTLYIVHAANPALLGFGPVFPSIIQEIVDRIKYL